MKRRALWIAVLAILVLPFAVSAESYELTFAFYMFGGTPADLPLVQDAINAIAEQKIGATVKLTPISFGAYWQQMNLMLASGEKLDLMATGGANYATQAAKRQLTPLDDLLPRYGQGIVKALGPYAYTAKIGGKTCAVASLRDLSANRGINMRKDILDKYKVDPKSIKTLKDVEALLKTVKQKEPDLTPVMPAINTMSLVDFCGSWDVLGDGFGVLMKYGDGLKVVNLVDTPEYVALVNTFRGWFQAGLVQKDAATNKEHWSTFLKANKLFATLHALKPGIDLQVSLEAGQPMVTQALTPAFAYTGTVTNVMLAVPRNTKNAEKAVSFLNLMYSDPVVVNLFDWGIEGRHYVKLADGHIDYPEGVNVQNTGYGLQLGWLFGNQFLSSIWKGNPLTLWKDMDAFNRGALKSKATGFTFDNTPVKAEIAALTNVANEYKIVLECGVVDPAETLARYRQKLKEAGIDRVIKEKQRQLDDWAAGK